MDSAALSRAGLTESRKGHSLSPEEQQLSNKLVYITMNLIGQKVKVRTTRGETYEGIYAGASNEKGFGVTLNSVRLIEAGPKPDPIMTRPLPSLTVDSESFVQLEASEVSFVEDEGRRANSSGAGFQTDTEISSAEAQNHGRSRELQEWVPDETVPDTGGLVDDGKKFDQFETNRRLFDYKSTYREEDYTTKLDRTGAFYRAHGDAAEKVAESVEATPARNPHVAEERGQKVSADLDSEDRYSGVLRDTSQKNTDSASKSAADSTKTDTTSTEPAASAKPKADDKKPEKKKTKPKLNPNAKAFTPAMYKRAPATPAQATFYGQSIPPGAYVTTVPYGGGRGRGRGRGRGVPPPAAMYPRAYMDTIAAAAAAPYGYAAPYYAAYPAAYRRVPPIYAASPPRSPQQAQQHRAAAAAPASSASSKVSSPTSSTPKTQSTSSKT